MDRKRYAQEGRKVLGEKQVGGRKGMRGNGVKTYK